MLRRIPALLIMLLALSCGSGDKMPEEVMDINKMKPIVWDLLRAGALSNLQNIKDSSLILRSNTDLFLQVFSIYGVTREQFYKSYQYYQQHPDKNKILMDSVMQYATRERGKLYQKVQ